MSVISLDGSGSHAAVGGAGVEALHFGGVLAWCSLLLLDSYRCNMMAAVVIHELCVEVQHIPGGCTGLCQHVDV